MLSNHLDITCMSHDIAKYEHEIKALKDPSPELMDERLISRR